MEEKLDAILQELKALRTAIEGQQELMTLEETAKFLGISMNVMYALKDLPGFPVKQLGPRVYRVPKQALIRWMNTACRGGELNEMADSKVS
jgi:predicted DNA-binding transcriptional regulator AlpA